MSAAHERIRYEAVAGPIRAELLDTERLEPTGLGLWDVQLQKGDEGRRVYALPGVPLERGFLVRSAEKGVYSDIWYFDPETAYPVCQPGARNFFFVAKGASPQPTPVPTPDTSGISTVLSSTRISHLAQTSDAVNRQLSCFSSRYMNLLAVFQI